MSQSLQVASRIGLVLKGTAAPSVVVGGSPYDADGAAKYYCVG